MKKLSIKVRSVFKSWGQQGGKKRAGRLSSKQRSKIASQAAHARWHKESSSLQPMTSIRLHQPQLSDPTYLDEILSEGSLNDWSLVYQELFDCPFGAVAEALESLLSSHPIYGVTPLWQGILHQVQGSYHEKN